LEKKWCVKVGFKAPFPPYFILFNYTKFTLIYRGWKGVWGVYLVWILTLYSNGKDPNHWLKVTITCCKCWLSCLFLVNFVTGLGLSRDNFFLRLGCNGRSSEWHRFFLIWWRYEREGRVEWWHQNWHFCVIHWKK